MKKGSFKFISNSFLIKFTVQYPSESLYLIDCIKANFRFYIFNSRITKPIQNF
jgi:hypothetical protein